jgi:hypothetical protein
LQKFTDIKGGETILQYDCAVIFRLVGNLADDIKSVTNGIVAILRRRIVAGSFSGTGKY